MDGRPAAHKIMELCILLLLFTGDGHAGTFSAMFHRDTLKAQSTNHPVKHFTGLLYRSSAYQASAVFKDASVIPRGLSIVFLSSALDAGIKRSMSANSNPAMDSFFDFTNHFGDRSWSWLALGMWAGGSIFQRKSLQKIGAELLISYGLTSAQVTILKNAIGRMRPYSTDDPYVLKGPGVNPIRYKSFPSGHASIAFATATVLSSHIQNKTVRWIIRGLAFSTALARVYKNKHWFSDTIAGGSIGYFTARTVIRISGSLD